MAVRSSFAAVQPICRAKCEPMPAGGAGTFLTAVPIAACDTIVGREPEMARRIAENCMDRILVQTTACNGGEFLAVPKIPAMILRANQQCPVIERLECSDNVA